MSSGSVILGGGGSGGSSSLATASMSGAGTISSTADIVFMNGASSFSGTLPSAASATKAVTLLKTDSTYNAITIARAGSDTIVDATSGLTSTTLNSPGESVYLVPDGASTWYVVKRDYPKTMQSFTMTSSGLPNAVSGNPTLGSGVYDASTHYLFARNRDGIEIDVLIMFSSAGSASSGTGDYLFPLPSGLVAASKLGYATSQVVVGFCQSYNPGGLQFEGHATLDSTGQNIKLRGSWSGSNTPYFIGGGFFQFPNVTTAFKAFVSIQGWN